MRKRLWGSELAAVFLGSILASLVIVCGCRGEVGDRPSADEPDAVDPVAKDDGAEDPADQEDPEAEAGGPAADLDPTLALGRPDNDPPGNAVHPTDVDPAEAGPDGQHMGERRQLDVDIVFSQEYGVTITDETGIHYHIGDWVFDEDKVYPSQYWGEFPLYYFGTEVGVAVTIRNNGPQKKAKLRIRTEAHVLLTDGTSGVALAAPQEFDVEVMRDESVTIDASFVAEYVAGAESGLDRFLVTVLHPNQGGGDPAIIMQKEGVFCPPDMEPL